MKNFVILMIVSVFLYENVLARDRDDRHVVSGVGQNLCGTMTEDVKTNFDGQTAYRSYIDGYISAVNLLSLGKADFFEGTDSPSRLTVRPNLEVNPRLR